MGDIGEIERVIEIPLPEQVPDDMPAPAEKPAEMPVTAPVEPVPA